MRNVFLALFISLFVLPLVAGAQPLVIVISVDGLSSRALSSLSPSEIPNLTRLSERGVKAIRAETVAKAQTIPGHASMLSGVDTAKHGMIFNELGRELKQIEVPTLFDLAKKNGKRAVAIFGKEKLRFMFDDGSLEKNISPWLWPIGDLWGRLPAVVDSTAIDMIRDKKPDLIFVHYALVDTIGHIFQWETPAQHVAIRNVDASIGRLLNNFDGKAAVSSYAASSYAVIVTADHGGHDGSHGQTDSNGNLENAETDLVIPWIAYRSGVKPAKLINAAQTVKVYDTAATAAALMGMIVPPEWNWDGVNRLVQ